ncbi:MAG: HYR domain-containing protein, partial [Deltaproteobacteria bacterium]|nr:HYR domain-containing protein [Deltaproteobacteria bacterium]
MTRHLAVILSAAGLLLASGDAHAAAPPTGSVTLSGPASVSPGALAYSLNYSLTGTEVSNAKIVAHFPQGVFVQGVSPPAGVTSSCSGNGSSPSGTNCTLNLNFSSGGVSGQATITTSLNAYVYRDGDTVDASATLSADYNDGSSVVPMTPVSDSESTPVVAFANMNLSVSAVSSAFVVSPTPPPGKSATGLQYTVRVRGTNTGNYFIDPHWTLAIDLPSYVYFVSTSGSAYDETPGPLAPWTTGNLVVGGSQAFSSQQDLLLTLWISCTDLPKSSAPLSVQFVGVEQKAAGPVAITQSTSYNGVPTAATGSCGTGGGASKSSSPEASVGEGENFTWSVGMTPPAGVVSVTDAVVVDRLPAKVVLQAVGTPNPAEFTAYYCTVPAETGNFSAAQFLNTYRTSACSTVAPADLTTVTHLVWYAASWGDANVGITAFSGSYTMNAPLDAFAHDEVVTNVAHGDGSFVFNASSSTFAFDATDTIAVKTAGQARGFLLYSTLSTPKSPGQTFTMQMTVGSTVGLARVKNPTVTLFVPDGLLFVSAANPSFNNGCNWSPPPTTYTAQPSTAQVAGGTLVTWQFGDASNPERLPFYCGGSSAANNPLRITVTLQVDPAAQLVNGQTISVNEEAWGENAPTHYNSYPNQIVTITVPGEMRTDVQPDCSAESEPSLLVRYENSGGLDLTNATVTARIPKIGDGSGTEVDTTFKRVENLPAGVTVEYEVGGSWTSTLPGNLALVTAVRVLEPAVLAPYGGADTFNVVLSVPGGTPTGTFIRGSSTMASTELGLLASAVSAPIKVNLCPGILDLHVFFDTDGSGGQNGGEPDLVEWQLVAVDDSDPGNPFIWETDEDGVVTQQLAPGDYTIVVQTPSADADAVWTGSTTIHVTVVSSTTQHLEVPIGCACNDDNSCTSDSCYLGACTYVADVEPAADDATCDGVDDDCDGATDEDFAGGEPVSCGDGVCRVTGATACEDGVVGVVVDGEFSLTCVPADENAGDEICDDEDNDCDGETDEGFGLGDNCSVGQGACAADGEIVCAPDGTATCDAVEGGGGVEVCDGEDNDCDGLTDAEDDIAAANRPLCELQGGVCGGSKKPKDLCVGGLWLPCTSETYASYSPQYAPVDGTCNGVDNDCAGGTDEDYVPTTTTCGVGRCAGATGQLVCEAGGTTRDTCNPTAGAQSETCNNLDDDCNGTTDDGFEVGGTCTIGQFTCQSSGHLVCGSSGQSTVCDAPVINGVTERCNDYDDDCDGEVDEDFALGSVCVVGLGECRREGVRVCVGETGLAGCDAEVVQGGVETCNGKDDDCDGATDEEGVCAALDTAITAGPDPVTASTSAHFTYVDPVTPSNPRFECSLDGGDWTTCDGNAIDYTGLSEGSHSLLVRAVGPNGNVDPTPAFYSWVIDTTEPDTFILAGPENPSQDPDGHFVFGSNVADPSAWYCAIDPPDGEPGETDWFPCDQTWTFEDLEDGEHTIWVYVVNELGVADTTPATTSWVIDTTAPGTFAVLVAETDVLCDDNVTIAISSDDETVAGFRCRLDDGAVTDCAGPEVTYGGLAEGDHAFEVAAVDGNGNVDPTPARVGFSVVLTPPEIAFVDGPDFLTQSGAATFTFAASAGATVTCRLDGGELAPCTSPKRYFGLADGEHLFELFAADACGAAEEPVTWEWIIDTTFPETAYLTTPPAQNGYDDPNDFTYHDPTNAEADVFECRLDGAEGWESCDGGAISLGTLPVGTHTLHVRTCEFLPNESLQCDPTPAVYTWEVTESPCPLDRVAPALTCPATQVVECSGGTGVVDALALTPTATDACAPVDVSTSSEGTFPYGLSPLVYEATDGNGNRATCATGVSVVDTTAPAVTCPADVALTTPEDACGVAYELAAATATDGCFEAVTVLSNAPPIFGVGDTVVTFTAVDAAGNSATCTTTVTVTDDVPLTLVCPGTLERTAAADVCGWQGSVEATATDNCAVDVTVLQETNFYAVGTQDVVFDAADDDNNTATCTTALTVVDATDPVVTCPEAASLVPATLRATATDACTATLAITGLTCTRVGDDGGREAIAAADCPAVVEGDVVRVTGRVAEGTLEVGFTATGTDPSGNAASKVCAVTFGADFDADGIVDAVDNCPTTANTDQTDGDGDGVGDACDVCPAVADADQADGDGNGVGDACQDSDGDGVLDLVDNCPLDANADQADHDGDGIGNVCDESDDGIFADG